MSQYVNRGSLSVAIVLCDFVETSVLPDIEISAEVFWLALSKGVELFTDDNKSLLETRIAFQRQIDKWHISRKGEPHDSRAYESFLREIGYIVDEPDEFTISTGQVDPEISKISGPQLVVPIKNARYALNAANARWGSLYDALYGTDAIMPPPNAGGYNTKRGAKVISHAKSLLDKYYPLSHGQWTDVTALRIESEALVVVLPGKEANLKNAEQFVGYLGSKLNPENILLRNNGLHFDICIDADDPVGKTDPANIRDIEIESALTTILDCEDSVAAVDAEDKVDCYKNMLGLMSGKLVQEIVKDGHTFVRSLNADRTYVAPDGAVLRLPGLSRLLIRNVGHLMHSSAVRDAAGTDIFEGLLDSFVTGLIAHHDLQKLEGAQKNSPFGSVYIVKPKMHGPDEVEFANRVFNFVEDALSLPRNTLKIGIMDEERRTSVNLKACIHAARKRIIFINTGFLDRTGDEIHTSMEAGTMHRKADIKTCPWLQAYENRNVDMGLATGFMGRAQIGKGMWPKPDEMADMMATKGVHPKAGANCAWAPSPTAATLHALHYHDVDVRAVQTAMLSRPIAPLSELLKIPVCETPNWTKDEITEELDNNIQGILGYVVRWVDQGIGCSKVPDIFDVGLMEDRATLRISSQHVANWLHHGICSEDDVSQSLKRMAAIVDKQNAHDPAHRPMSKNLDSNIAFQAASDLIFKGQEQPSGYTEPLLHAARMAVKKERSHNGYR